MRKGTFSVQNASTHSSKHNSREEAPKYLIGLESGKSNYYELIVEDKEFVENAKLRYKKCVKQNMQKKQIPGLIKETILTLKEHQDENDVKALFKELNKKYGGHFLTEVSIHRDEGHFVRNDIAYYPTKNIIQKENNWYICSNAHIEKPKKNDFDVKVDINEFKKVYNYHAHAKFSMFDMNTGKTARIDKKAMSSRIKFISKYLGLEYGPGKDRYVKKSVNQIKDEHLAASNEKIRELAKQKDLKLEIARIREELQKEKATRKDYAALEELNRNLKKKISNKQITIDEMQNEIDTLNEQFNNNINPIELEKELESVLDEHLEEQEVKIGLFGKETKTIVEDKFSFRNALSKLISKGAVYLLEKYKELQIQYENLKEKYIDVKEENIHLKSLIERMRYNHNNSKKMNTDISKNDNIKRKFPEKRY